jgi:hypothetical protein
MYSVWIVLGCIDYEGSRILAVCETKEIAEKHQAEQKADEYNFSYFDHIEIQEHYLNTK